MPTAAAVFDCLPLAVVVASADGTVLVRNKAATALFDGRTYANVLAAVPPEDLPDALAALASALGGGPTRHRLRLIVGVDPRPASFDVDLLDARSDPQIGGLVFTLHRLPDAVAAAPPTGGALPPPPPPRSAMGTADLAILDAVPDAVFINVDGVVAFTNRAGAELYGVASPAVLIGRPVETLVPAGEYARVDERARRVEDGDRAVGLVEERIVRDDGSVREVEVSSTSVTFGGRSAVAVSLRDISARKQADAERHRRDELFRQLFEGSPVGMFLTEAATGAFVQANPAGLAMVGYTAEELAACTIWDLTPSEYHASEPALFDELARTGAVGPYEKENIHKLGHRIPIVVSSLSVRADDGTPLCWTFAQDVSLIRQREAELEEAVSQAEQASRAKNQFLSRMSHELRTPMNAVIGFAHLLSLGDLDADQREEVSHIQRAGEHLLGLINEVLDIARIEQGTLPVELADVDTAPVIADVLALVGPMAGDRQVRVLAGAGCDRSHTVRADGQRLREVLFNLLSNACKYNRPGGEVHVTVARDDERGDLMIAVRDTGIGVAAHDLDKLFQPFERLGAADLGVEGTGIGLTITQRLVHAMNGMIVVESERGVGSTFTVHLPEAGGAGAVPANVLRLPGRAPDVVSSPAEGRSADTA